MGIDGVDQIWRDAKMRAVGKARAKTLIEAAEHSVGSKEGAVSARMEIRMLLETMNPEIRVYRKLWF